MFDEIGLQQAKVTLLNRLEAGYRAAPALLIRVQ
jgi:hypothetical protein